MKKIEVYTKLGCGYCVKAKQLLRDLGLNFTEILITSVEELPKLLAHARTMPQIVIGGSGIIGGFDELYVLHQKGEFIPALAEIASKKTRTVFNLDNSGHENSSYPLFLGEELGLTDTINQPYPVIEKLYDMQMGQIWNHLEVDLTKDRQDMLNADPKVVELMVKTISWQWLADSIASRSITGTLLDNVSNSDLEAWYNAVSLFESIHAKTYSHIAKQTFLDPTEAIKKTYEDMEIIKRSNILKDAFDDLANLPWDAPKWDREEKLYVALVALYMLESVNFMASFAITFGIAETGIFQGISQNVVLICRDEMLHGLGGSVILGIQKEVSPELFQRLKPKFQEIYDEIKKTEHEWTDYLFSEGRQCPGINADRIKKYVDYVTQPVAETLGLEYDKIEENPLPYMESYIDSTKIQVAAQELQLTSYLVNAVKPIRDKESLLTKLKKDFN